MTQNASPMPGFFDSTTPSRTRTTIYWIATIILVLECEVGGVVGGLRLQPFLGTIQHLGYPTYFMTIHTIWYILAGVALLVSRFPRLKEWAYASLFFIYTGAFMSHLAVGDPAFMGTGSRYASATQCKQSHLILVR